MRRSLALTVLACLGVLGATSVAAQTPEIVPLSPGTSAISGRVTDARSGERLAGVGLTITAMDRREQERISSKPDGTYSVDQIAAGRYRLVAEKPGYVPSALGANRYDSSGTLVEISAGHRTEDIDMALSPGAIVRGRITDEDGRPVPRLSVIVTSRENAGDDFQGLGRPADTNERGEYEVWDLPEGHLYVAALRGRINPEPTQRAVERARYERTFYPGVTTLGEATAIQTVAGETASDIDFAVRRGANASLTVHVVHASGALPSPLMLVVASTAGGTANRIEERAFGRDGRVTVSPLQPGPHIVWAHSFGRTSSEAGLALVDADGTTPEVTVTLEPAASLSGQVVAENGQPLDLPDIWLSAVITAGMRPLTPNQFFHLAKLAPDGRFAFTTLFGHRTFRLSGVPPSLSIKAVVVGDQRFGPETPIAFPSGQHVRNARIIVRAR